MDVSHSLLELRTSTKRAASGLRHLGGRRQILQGRSCFDTRYHQAQRFIRSYIRSPQCARSICALKRGELDAGDRVIHGLPLIVKMHQSGIGSHGETKE
jgi:hypothetical protein